MYVSGCTVYVYGPVMHIWVGGLCVCVWVGGVGMHCVFGYPFVGYCMYEGLAKHPCQAETKQSSTLIKKYSSAF